jgi:hypothetical protein
MVAESPRNPFLGDTGIIEINLLLAMGVSLRKPSTGYDAVHRQASIQVIPSLAKCKPWTLNMHPRDMNCFVELVALVSFPQ